MDNPPAPPTQSAPPSGPTDGFDAYLVAAFRKELTDQPARMDAFAHRVIWIQLAIPGLLGVALTVIGGKDATIPVVTVVTAFGLWFVAILLSLSTLLPTTGGVNPSLTRRLSGQRFPGDPQTILEWYQDAPRRKAFYLRLSAVLFFLGCAASLCGLLTLEP